MSRALLISLLLHGFLITLLVELPEIPWIREAGAPIHLVLSPRGGGLSAVAERPLAPKSSRKAAVLAQPSAVPHPPQPLAAKAESPISVPEVEARASPAMVKPAVDLVPTLAASREMIAPDRSGTGAPAVNREATAVSTADELEALQTYRLNLGREARRYRLYPSMARERGWEGTSVLDVMTIPGGAIPEVRLTTGSGRDLLDDAALRMIRQAVRTAELPEALKGKAFRVTVPIRFALQD